MSTVPFDTYRFTRRLIDAGMSEKLAQELVIAATEASENLATSTDIETALHRFENSLLIKIGGMLVAAVGLLKVLP
ncbi:hypothetical protein dqs_1799 [Azoarcus olearius]|uniref:hypothetical protein n=1 Tax=Azoarcus sp. (strain BH72) TaxID=418699 RepID=UPI0008063299|nr:hypothetical protein [Azoarcus olearius]ANQ84837.1 hypothetical protein dqs_1799 [Azoarcus olearius]